MPPQPDAFFLPDGGRGNGQRFCLFHPPHGNVTLGSILYIHPFAEEMNKSRRMIAMQARSLSSAGYAVLQFDLLGCGDSSGDFGDATWEDWLADTVRAAEWLIGRNDAPLWLWGLRSGCLLAAQAAPLLPKPCNFLFWAPAAAGKLLLLQFLRLKAAAAMLAGNAKGVTEKLRQELAAGASVEVAGYSLSPLLCNGLESAALAPPVHLDSRAALARLEWFELSSREGATLSPVGASTCAQWSQAGVSVRTHVVAGASFWQTSEIEEAPALISATVAAISPHRQPIAA